MRRCICSKLVSKRCLRFRSFSEAFSEALEEPSKQITVDLKGRQCELVSFSFVDGVVPPGKWVTSLLIVCEFKL